MVVVFFKKLTEKAKIPAYTREQDACMDLASVEEIIIPAHGTASVRTGLACEVPAGYEMQIRGRSGLAAKHGIGLTNGIGTVDSEYRGELMVLLANHSGEDFQVEEGMRIAQFCVVPVLKIQAVETDKLSETVRGTGGLGSSGLK